MYIMEITGISLTKDVLYFIHLIGSICCIIRREAPLEISSKDKTSAIDVKVKRIPLGQFFGPLNGWTLTGQETKSARGSGNMSEEVTKING